MLSEDKIEFIRKRLLDGCSCQDISEELKIGVATVKRYKKQFTSLFTDKEKGFTDAQVNIDYQKYMTKREQRYFQANEKELYLFDDPIEGWVHHVSKGDARLKMSSMWWSAIVYPESAPVYWIDQLRAEGFRIAISPLHDRDLWDHDSPMKRDLETGEIIYQEGELYKKGDKKKAHWHIILVVDKRISFTEMNDTVQSICHCPCIKRCNTLKGAYSYFLHVNHPEKCQDYKKEDIQIYNDFHVEPNNFEKGLMCAEMTRIIDDHHIETLDDCVDFFRDSPEYIMLLTVKCAFFTAYLKSKYVKSHPQTVRFTEVKNVSRFSFEPEPEPDYEFSDIELPDFFDSDIVNDDSSVIVL